MKHTVNEHNLFPYQSYTLTATKYIRNKNIHHVMDLRNLTEEFFVENVRGQRWMTHFPLFYINVYRHE